MWRDYGLVYQIAVECAKRYYSMGHQVVFAIHHAPKDEIVGNKGGTYSFRGQYGELHDR